MAIRLVTNAIQYPSKLFKDLKPGEVFRLVCHTDGKASGGLQMKLREETRDGDGFVSLETGGFGFCGPDTICNVPDTETLLVIV